MSTQRMTEILQTADKAQPIAMINGIPAYTFEDNAALASVDNINDKKLGLTKFNPDGTPARTNTERVAINVGNFFINRYKVVKKNIYLVNDYYCISEQALGKVPYKQVPCYVIARGEDGRLKLERITTVSDEDFLANFKNSLDRESMMEILPLLVNDTGITQDKLPI